MRIFVVLAAYNEAQKIGGVLESLFAAGYSNVLVCDDGSKDQTTEIARKAGAVVVRHPINRGAGAATKTGLEAAIRLGADIMVVMDADGQHAVEDVAKLIDALKGSSADVAIGDRMHDKQQMPFVRRIFNGIANLITQALGGAAIADSQSGFKAFTRKAVETIRIRSNGFEFCSEIVREIKLHELHFVEVPIQVIYSDYSRSKGQSFYNGARTAWRLFIRSLT